MKIGITSQNFRTITGHAGKARRFLIYESSDTGEIRETARWDLPKEMALHAFRGDAHPLYTLDVLITAGCGEHFLGRLAQYGVRVIRTGEPDPDQAARMLAAGQPLPPPANEAVEPPG